ncbi:filamentous hemagglutinin N-terminal domain-containing protein [Nostoc sp. CENA67]|uniref:Filamentous hemagglutinin N-terminal domain-containing protein n=1 Tax=Amazonocrinis nigriterrae CENA67 TaxID=2794033 RepID=A0A8J7HY96_9NOST|nr:filamentous hemagglutinin N-terminal domain-containing protein [Amazonocrinis nigriterrae]MBH8567232.1 filamentous hemagglutinin N-terminal domain-containing protein [Amazonocrinis nigriterrae CENA67]
MYSIWPPVLRITVVCATTLYANKAISQITPDSTLTEKTQINTVNNITNITGGTKAGSNLFHSFTDFSVLKDSTAYFNNAADVQNIISRVTGSSISKIDGLIKANGTANLFLLNPNGIIFSENAQLSIGGSFVASTASSLKFPDGSEFSITNPQSQQLLTINLTPGLQYGVSQPKATITNAGNLVTQQDLTLVADKLDLQGQLVAGRDLTIQGQTTVQVRDHVQSPFKAQAGRNLTIQGDRGIDIVALNSPVPASFVSGGNLRLISDGVISGDGRFSSGGSFSLESLSGELANLVSLHGPIISSNSDVDVAANYTGASLLVEAKGNIRWLGDINITQPNNSNLPSDADTTKLSTTPALIMRSGQSTLAYGNINSDSAFLSSSSLVPTGITLGGNVTVQPFNDIGGTVDLLAASGNVNTQRISTNGETQSPYYSIEVSPGIFYTFFGQINNANGGAIKITAQNGGISTGDLYSHSYSSSGNTGNGGDIILEAGKGSINTGNLFSFSRADFGSFLSSYHSDSGNAGNGGAITLSAVGGDINSGDFDSSSSAYFSSGDGMARDGGAITLSAFGGSININNLKSLSYAVGSTNTTGNGGAITLSTVGGDINSADFDSSSFAYFSSSYSKAGNGGAITLSTTDGDINTNNFRSFSYASSFTNSTAGNGGAITLSAVGGDINTLFVNSYSISTGFNSSTGGNGGAITLSAARGGINTSSLNSSSYSFSSTSSTGGNGGAITLSTTDGDINTSDFNSSSTSSGSTSTGGNGGAITLSTTDGDINTFSVKSSSTSTGSTSSTAGNGGEITLFTTDGDINTSDFNSSSTSSGSTSTAGNGGAITLSTTDGNINTSDFNSSSYSSGSTSTAKIGGKINLFAFQDININRVNSFSVSSGSTSTAGNGGEISIESLNGNITANDLLSTSYSSTQSAGNGGSVSLNAVNIIKIRSINSTGRLGSGNITLKSNAPFVMDNSIIFSDTFGSGKAGDISITAPSISLTNSAQISANTHSSGQGGDIRLVAADSIELSGTSELIPGGIFSDFVFDNASGIPPGTYLGGFIPTGTIGEPPEGTLFPSGVFAQTTVGSTGSAGNLTFETDRLIIKDGAAIATTTFGQSGNAGNIAIQANDSISVNNGSILSGVAGGARGNSGNIQLKTSSLSLSNRGIVQTQTLGAGKAGDIQIIADAVSLLGAGSGILSGSGGSNEFLGTTGDNIGSGGDISITTNSLSIADAAVLDAQTQTNSRGGNIIVNANTLNALNGGQLRTSTSAGGQAGDMRLNVSEIVLSGSQTGLFAQTNSSANAGKIVFQPFDSKQTLTINLLDGAQISASTASLGQGGSLTFAAPESITLKGNGTLTATAEADASGQAGDVLLTTKKLNIADGIRISAATNSTNPTAHGGNLHIRTTQLNLTESSSLEAGTTGAAPGGNLTIQPDENSQTLTVNFQGASTASASTSGSGKGGTLKISAPDSIILSGNGSLVSAETTGSGAGGNLILETGKITVQDEAQVTVNSTESGTAGSLIMSANSILLDNKAKISADTTGGGGDIFINTPSLVLRRGSSITTNAQGDNIPGGNITINNQGGFIIAVPQENSDISANSRDFRGGQIKISTQGIFGTQFRNTQTPDSDITATGVSSQLNGTVLINTPDVDPSRGLTPLPENFVDPSSLITQNACQKSAGSRFVITGRSGLPLDPSQVLTSEEALVDWIELTSPVTTQLQRTDKLDTSSTSNTHTRMEPIVEAQRWVINNRGEVILIAPSQASTPNWQQSPASCSTF